VQVVSVNTGQPRDVPWRGRTVRTGIFKTPRQGTVTIGRLNVDGDAQADTRVHGGPHKAVYAFAAENYAYWQKHYPALQMHWGFFGENLTTRGLDDFDVHVGDVLRVGHAELRVTQPRLPCSRLALRFDDAGIVAAFVEQRRVGFYCAVQQEGVVTAGDDIETLSRNDAGWCIPELAALLAGIDNDPERLRRASRDDSLPESWRERFVSRLRQTG
jgi:MOSC domain-containing protein YiiM